MVIFVSFYKSVFRVIEFSCITHFFLYEFTYIILKDFETHKWTTPKKISPICIMHSELSSGSMLLLLEMLYHFLEVIVPGMLKHFTIDIGGKLEFMTYPTWHWEPHFPSPGCPLSWPERISFCCLDKLHLRRLPEFRKHLRSFLHTKNEWVTFTINKSIRLMYSKCSLQFEKGRSFLKALEANF